VQSQQSRKHGHSFLKKYAILALLCPFIYARMYIWVKTWGQVLDENRGRLQFFQVRLEYEADKGASLEFLQKTYAQFLQGVLVEETTEETAAESARVRENA
jgi:hypothetical protein